MSYITNQDMIKALSNVSSNLDIQDNDGYSITVVKEDKYGSLVLTADPSQTPMGAGFLSARLSHSSPQAEIRMGMPGEAPEFSTVVTGMRYNFEDHALMLTTEQQD